MKFSAYSKWATNALMVFALFVTSTAFAADPGDSDGQPPRRKYTFVDFVNYYSSFSKVPSTFTWDSVPQNEGSPGRVVDPSSVPTQVPKISPPLAAPPACLATAPWNEIYSGACVSTSPTIPFAADSSLGYDGTYCYGKLGSFHVTYTDSAGTAKKMDVRAFPPARTQYQVDPITGQVTVACAALKDQAGATLSVSGKTLSGNVIFRCQAGVWRVINVSCTDLELKCPAETKTITFGASDGMTYPMSINLPSAVPGAFGAEIACTSLGSPGAGYNWAAGNVRPACDGAGAWVANGTCVKTVKPVVNTIYPNCAGGTQAEVKAGITACSTTDGTKYYWVLVEGMPVDQCPDPNGCAS